MKQKETIIKVLTYIKKYRFVVILSLFLAALTVYAIVCPIQKKSREKLAA